MWHPRLKLGFAYVPGEFHMIDFVNERGRQLQEVVTRCAEKYMRA